MTTKDILHKTRKLKALVIGDIMLDHYIWGGADRISPEAPVPVVRVTHEAYSMGGAANVAANLRALGASVELWGWIADDDSGKRLTRMFKKQGISFRKAMFAERRSATIVKTRIMVQHQQICRFDREPCAPPPSPAEIPSGMEPLLRRITACDAVIVSDYAKGGVTDRLLDKIAGVAHAAGKLVALDPKPRRKLHFHDLDLITPNRKEAMELAGTDETDFSSCSPEKLCQTIWKKHRIRYIVITMGSDGMLLSERGKLTKTIPTVAREVFDVSGAGDTVIAALSLALAAGVPFAEAAAFANTAAGVVVGKLGTATASPEEILAHSSR